MPSKSSNTSRASPTFKISKSSYSYKSPKSPILPSVNSVNTPSTMQHNVNVQQPGFFSNMWQGFGFGTGQTFAHNLFRSDPTVTHIHTNAKQTISTLESNLPKEFVQCMKDNNNDKELCKQFLE